MKGKDPAFDGAWLRAVRMERGLSAQDVERMARVKARPPPAEARERGQARDLLATAEGLLPEMGT